MTRRLHLKPGLQEQIRINQKGVDLWAAMADRPTLDLGAKEKRVRGPVNAADTEAPVLNAVGQYLGMHPRVAICLRVNSGMAYSQSGAPVWFHKLICGDGVMVDYFGLVAARRGVYGAEPWPRPFAIECKKPGWSGVSRTAKNETAERERKQERFIQQVIALGGIGGFVRSVDEAIVIVEGK